MEILEVKATIERWIYSCDRIEQLEGLEKSVPDLIDNLFQPDKRVTAITITITKDYLLADIKERKEFLKQTTNATATTGVSKE